MPIKRNCKKGYSCGRSCINVRFMCRTDGLKGQAIKLADTYFNLTKNKTESSYKPGEEHKANIIERQAYYRNMLGDDEYDKLNSKLKSMIADLEPVIYIRGSTLAELAEKDATEYKTLFETGTSGGSVNMDARSDAEYASLGISRDTKPEARPIYAGIDRKADYKQYGDIQLQPKEIDRANITITLDDSLNRALLENESAMSYAHKLDDDDLVGLLPELDRDKLDFETLDELYDIMKKNIRYFSYFELQMHKRPLKLSDLKAIDGYDEEIKIVLDKLGIEYE